MRYDPPSCCPLPQHPPRIDIPPGMTSLVARQIAAFPQWREALLGAIDRNGVLGGWTADRPGDLGVMLVEFWAYILDVTAFYDARIAERAFLLTASEPDVVGEIVALLGYVPRPALAASVKLALDADGADPVQVPNRTGFRSEAFGSEPPQVFEMMAAATIWPQRNGWTLAPYRPDQFDGALRFLPGGGPARGNVIVIQSSGSALVAGEVATVDTEANPDGQRYQSVVLKAGASISPLAGKALSSLDASALGLRAALSPFVDTGGAISGTVAPSSSFKPSTVSGASSGTGWVVLDTFYPQIAKGSVAALEIAGKHYPVIIEDHLRFLHSVTVGTSPNTVTQQVPASLITFAWSGSLSGRDMFLHAVPRALGPLTRPASLQRTLGDIISSPALLPLVPPLGDAPAWGDVLAVGLAAQGALLDGIVEPGDAGTGDFIVGEDVAPFSTPLSIPVRLLGNVLGAVRGETVAREVLGSGDSSQPFQSFKLQKKPLTWVTNASTEVGRSPQIEIAVDGLYWTWVETLYGAMPQDRIFIVAMDPDGTAHVGFGDGVAGSRLPTGVSNVVARYRFGAGAAKPPAGSIKQIVQSVMGLKRVTGPLAAVGGADAEPADAIRVTAPASMLSLGRAVSADDYLAMARSYNGVINAAVAERWDVAKLRVAVDISIIAEGGDPSADLADFLTRRSAPGIPVTVSAAARFILRRFDVAVTVADGYVADTVRANVTTALFDAETGLLGPARVPIGAPLFHSVIVAAIFDVPGVADVPAITLSKGPMGAALVPPAGSYFDFLENGKVV